MCRIDQMQEQYKQQYWSSYSVLHLALASSQKERDCTRNAGSAFSRCCLCLIMAAMAEDKSRRRIYPSHPRKSNLICFQVEANPVTTSVHAWKQVLHQIQSLSLLNSNPLKNTSLRSAYHKTYVGTLLIQNEKASTSHTTTGNISNATWKRMRRTLQRQLGLEVAKRSNR